MKRFSMIVPALLGVAALAAAEDSFLERLQKETRTLAATARQATVEVRVPGARKAGTSRWVLDAGKAREQRNAYNTLVYNAHGVLKHEVVGTGVLVGTPPVVVVPYSVAANAKKIQVTLADSSETSAERLGGDAELGVAVFAMPEDVAAKWRGTAATRDWKDLTTGSLAVHARGSLGLALVQGADPVLGWLYAGEGQLGGALVGAGGKLLGVGGGSKVASAMFCGNCHTGMDDAAVAPNSVLRVQGPLVAQAHRQWTGYRNSQTGSLVRRRANANVHARNAYVPGPVIARVVADLKEHGRVRHSFLGVVLGETVGEKGVEITTVLDKSPARKAGLETGQKVVSVNGVRCGSSEMLSRALAMRAPGDRLTLRVRRGEDVRDVEVELGDLTEARRDLVNESNFGLTCVDPSDELRGFFGIAADRTGVLVQGVRRGSSAYRAGLRRGDLIVWGGDGNIANLEELRAALAGAKGSVSIRWRREGEVLGNSLKVPKVKRTTR